MTADRPMAAFQPNAEIHNLMSRLLEVIRRVPILMSDEGRIGSGTDGQVVGQVMRPVERYRALIVRSVRGRATAQIGRLIEVKIVVRDIPPDRLGHAATGREVQVLSKPHGNIE